MAESMADEKKRKIKNATPCDFQKLKEVGGFRTSSGLTQFLKRHDAIINRVSIYTIDFLDNVNADDISTQLE